MTDTKPKRTPKEYCHTCLELLAKARLAVLEKGPYFSQLLYTLVPVLVPGMGTVAVTDTMLLLLDPIRVVDDPELGGVDDKGVPNKLAGVLVHECMHILRDMERVKSLAEVDMELANIAADLPINEDLRNAGWQLPNWVLYPDKYNYPKNETMEQYFERLLKEPTKNKEKTYQMVADAKAGGKGKGKGKGKPDPNAPKLDVGAGQCGSAAGNQNQPTNDAAKDAQDKGRHAGEVDSSKKQTLEQAKKHYGGPGCGDVPGWIEEELDKLGRKRKDRDWKKMLNQVVRRTSGMVMAGGADFSMARPSRRSLLREGLLRPGLVEQQYEASLAIDTSGSMGPEQLNYAKNAVVNIMSQTGLDTVWLMQCDARVQMPFTRIRLRDIPDMKMRGRGGTNFIPIFGALKRLRPKPDLIILLTDGDGPAPEKAPYGTAVIWVIVPSHWRRKPTEWGHYIICTNEHSVMDEFEDDDVDEVDP